MEPVYYILTLFVWGRIAFSFSRTDVVKMSSTCMLLPSSHSNPLMHVMTAFLRTRSAHAGHVFPIVCYAVDSAPQFGTVKSTVRSGCPCYDLIIIIPYG
ncbi:hypothetical protein M432DRAFT_353894 [Thermoascus aurantiacus ATCC 26904]